MASLCGYDHLERVRWDVAQSVLVDVDALDDLAVLGSVHDLVLRVLGLVKRQSQLFHGFHLHVVRGAHPPKRVVYTEHNTNPEGGVQRPNATGWRPSQAPLGVHVLLPKTATTSLASASRGCDAGPPTPWLPGSTWPPPPVRLSGVRCTGPASAVTSTGPPSSVRGGRSPQPTGPGPSPPAQSVR